ncbi:inverse autotransporter beta domain-containing protein [Escherichia coli]|nr:inverse autotransporter beta domain-containing protein [Escherichia coli]
MSHYKTGHKQPRFRYSVLARCVAWANISVQVLFPLAVTFTPVMAARAQHAVQPRLSMGNTTVTADNNVEKNVASFAANAGTFLSSQPDSDATRNFITGMATAKANQEIQEWLGKYGTARVKLNVDKDFSLKDSSLEMLYPIYDTPTNMLFTQGAIHRTDDRTQSNIGFGWRHFSGNDWMAGVNTFIDHDLSRSHTRIGVGAEYWRDYLKLSANGYIRASGWKKSPDIEDYQERPANGWDIRAEGYLPAWPQLGASLMYEQYYGDEVGLFGKDKRQKDPHAISAEVTYTPVPLLTLSAGHKQGKSGENDTRFGLEVYYRIGEPLAKQLDTDSIRERRVLAGSRYDLVERNNNIVLEYRKSEVIRIALPERIEGKGGQTLSLGLVVSKATHGLKNVQWEAPSLLAEGGKITGQGSQWQVTLPAYRPGKDNYYAISAVAYDNKGNASKRVQTEVVITGAGMSADRTALTLDGQSRIQMLANGNEQRPLVLSLRDAEGQPVTGMKDQIKTELAFKPAGNIVTRSLKATKSQAKPTLGEFTETEAGVYQSVFTTGTQSGEATITVSVDGMSKTVTAELRATMMDVANSTLSANEPSGDVVADGQQAYTLTLTAVDSEGNPVTGEASRLRFVPQDTNGVTVGAISEIKPGVYSATVSSTRAGNVVVRAFSEQYQLGTLQQTLKFVAGPLDAAHSSITLNPDKPVVGGTVTAIWTAKDAYDNPVTSLTPEAPSLAGAAAVGSTASGWTNNGDGTWTAQITLGSTAGAGEHSITASVNNAQKTVTVKFKADFSTGQATLEVDGSTPKVANDNDAFTLTATVKDQYGNLLPGAVVVFNLPRGVKPLADGNIMVNADKEGKAELKVVSVTAGTYEITASAGNDQPSNAQSVTFVADKTTATISSIEVIGNRAVADGKTKQTYKVTVTDANNNLLKDSDVTLTASSENLVLDPKGTAKTNEQGQAVFTGSTTIAATYTLTAKVEQANGQVSTKTAESKFVADDKNAVLAASPERVDSLVADGKTTATMTVTLMAGVNPVGGSMWVDIEAPEGVTEKDYQFLPSKADHFSGGKITRTFSTSKPGVYTFTFNALTYGGYEMTPVKVTINAVAAETENGEEEMP